MEIKYLKKHKLPETPGIYFFLGRNKKPLYIGKATSLRDRVRSYFSSDLVVTRGKHMVKMLEEAISIDFKPTDSVLEALLLEADLIKKFRPPYNTKEKDDKSFNCVVLTKEDFPRLLVIRKKDINYENLESGDFKLKSVFGPYTNGLQLKEALRIIRKIIPYRDHKCLLTYDEQIEKGKTPRACFARQIGLCPGVCTGEISKKDYEDTVKDLELLLSGKIETLKNKLEKEMGNCAEKENFEEANKNKRKIYSLTHIEDISLIKKDRIFGGEERIESYDIAHLGGSSMVGVMTVVKNGLPDKSSYRKFNIRSVTSSNDPKALREVIKRRLTHPEWPLPNIFVIDGGIAQKNAIESELKSANISIPVVSVVKDERHRAREILGDQVLCEKNKREILMANAESHRFALAFHKKKRSLKFLENLD